MTNEINRQSSTKEMIAIMQAAVDGETIEYQTGRVNSWITTEYTENIPWDFMTCSYRIKAKEPIEFYARVRRDYSRIEIKDVAFDREDLGDPRLIKIIKVREVIEEC